MKKILFMLPILAVALVSCNKDNGNSKDGIIQFNDQNFLKALLLVQPVDSDYAEDGTYTMDVDINRDRQISVDEAKSAIALCLNYYESGESCNISDLSEIKYFTSLECLYCSYNRLTTLDLSDNTALTELYCMTNQLTSLDVSKCTSLKQIWCEQNNLTSLNIHYNTALEEFGCSDNQLTSLDLSTNVALEMLACDDNQITTLDLSHNTKLRGIYCENNPLETLIISASQQNASWLNDVKSEYPDIEIIVK